MEVVLNVLEGGLAVFGYKHNPLQAARWRTFLFHAEDGTWARFMSHLALCCVLAWPGSPGPFPLESFFSHSWSSRDFSQGINIELTQSYSS